MSIFLDPDDVATLTGKKTKSGQIDQLRRMGFLFYVNATGHPVVPKSAIGLNSEDLKPLDAGWKPNVLNHGSSSKR